MLELTPELGVKFAIISNAIKSYGLVREVEIGDILQATFYPQIKVSHWNNECNFSQRLVIPGYIPKDADVSVVGGRVKLTTPNIVVEWEDVGSDVDNEEGQVVERVTFLSKPVTNQLIYTLEAKNVSVHKQPVLEGVETGSDAVGPFFIPFAVQGSYAIYHAAGKRHNEYKVGKLGHVQRPLITGGDLSTAYCDMDINLPLKQMIVTIPAAFYDVTPLPWVM